MDWEQLKKEKTAAKGEQVEEDAKQLLKGIASFSKKHKNTQPDYKQLAAIMKKQDKDESKTISLYARKSLIALEMIDLAEFTDQTSGKLDIKKIDRKNIAQSLKSWLPSKHERSSLFDMLSCIGHLYETKEIPKLKTLVKAKFHDNADKAELLAMIKCIAK